MQLADLAFNGLQRVGIPYQGVGPDGNMTIAFFAQGIDDADLLGESVIIEDS